MKRKEEMENIRKEKERILSDMKGPDLDRIKDEKERILNDLKAEDIELDDYNKLWSTYQTITEIEDELTNKKVDTLWNQYKTVNEIEEEIRNGKRNRSWIPVAIALVTGLAGAAATVFSVVYLGQLSYSQDQELNLCNGRVFNLAAKLLNFKTDIKI